MDSPRKDDAVLLYCYHFLIATNRRHQLVYYTVVNIDNRRASAF